MKRALLWTVGILAALVVVGVGVLAWTGIPGKASSMAAKTVCSAAFVAGRPTTADLFEQDVLPASSVLAVVSTDIDEQAKRVTARFLGLVPNTASLVADRGCVLDTEPDPAAVAWEPSPDPRPWPEGDAALPPDQWPDGVDAAALQATVDAAFVGAGDPQAANARGLAVVHDGQLLVSGSAPDFDPDTALHGWSMTKTLTGMLFHKLATDRGLSLETPVVDSFPGGTEPGWVVDWRGDDRALITIGDLLYMRDGLANTEGYEITGDVPQMLYDEPDMAQWAADRPADVPPGQRFQYLSATTNILSAVARAQFQTDAEYWAYPRTALFEPVGADSAVIEADTAGTWVGGSYGWASAPDWARFGALMLADGRWQGAEVLPPGWLELAATPALAEGEGAAYGAQTWLIGEPDQGDCRDYPGVPADALAMQGHWGQLVAMVPSRDAVITRLGWTVADDVFDDCQLVSDVLAALPQ